MIKFYFVQVYYGPQGDNFGSFYLTKYDAAAFVINQLCGGMEVEDFPGEDDILAMKEKCDLDTGAGTTIASGEINRISFHIVEIEPGEIIDFNP